MKVVLNNMGKFICLIVSFIIYVILIILLLIISLRNIFSFKTINKLVQNIEIKNIISSINDDDIMSSIYNAAETYNISRSSVDSLLNSYTIKYLASKYIYGEVYYIINGSLKNVLSSEDFNNYINNNIDKIIAEGKLEYSEDEKDSITKLITDSSSEILNSLPDAESLINMDDNEALEYIRYIFSNIIIYYIIGILLFLIVLLTLLRWSLTKWLRWFGLTIMLSSIICIAVGLLPMFDYTSFIPSLPSYVDILIKYSRGIVSMCFIITGTAAMIIGLILIIIENKFKKSNINMD